MVNFTRRIQKIQEFIKDNYHEDISLDYVSEITCLHPKYFSRIFKETTGKGFREYKREVRIKAAKRFLAETDWSIDLIAEKTGYHDSSYFRKAFKKVTKWPPGKYRRYKACHRAHP